MPFITLYFEDDNIHCNYWVSKKGYCYRQSELESKPKRISEKAYMSAYETYFNL